MILLMYEPVPDHLQSLKNIAPQHEIVMAHSEEEAQRLIENAEIVLGNRYFLQSLPFARKLRWMQSNSVGVDLILKAKQSLIDKNITLTCARGVYDAELAEHTIALLLSLFRSLPSLRDEQNEGSWQRHRLSTLHGSSCLILGWGSLGKKIASYIKALGGKVAGVRNQPDDSLEGETMLFGSSNWRNQLPLTDALIICLPKTPETYHFIGKNELRALPSSAFVVNIGRGGTLDDMALLEMVQSGNVAGAALDVFEQEPLPAGHPIWKEPKIFVSPHVGRSLEGPVFRWQSLFEQNLERYLRGEALLNVVNYQKGY
ncbi:D-2-hydroxyacid dehydrogenase [Dyadobacter pollutisoli]|jgi:phosphoglycerate dehydrogenase-like enzyme|uniref:D-2-hydroxyacid dehydrogenase n=1 Tax=Dyadobacter pollutisoli TaxID=2910158 RepID=A0A9E8N9Z1_9BACT|nr:D-2-hydroxyacid dehydrogenase [Dyadobacter pollutisoli]WAC12724.1 D-2-hydroxyacid dehydrogenase [Dyadobacter pollutisoli]